MLAFKMRWIVVPLLCFVLMQPTYAHADVNHKVRIQVIPRISYRSDISQIQMSSRSKSEDISFVQSGDQILVKESDLEDNISMLIRSVDFDTDEVSMTRVFESASSEKEAVALIELGETPKPLYDIVVKGADGSLKVATIKISVQKEKKRRSPRRSAPQFVMSFDMTPM